MFQRKRKASPESRASPEPGRAFVGFMYLVHQSKQTVSSQQSRCCKSWLEPYGVVWKRIGQSLATYSPQAQSGLPRPMVQNKRRAPHGGESGLNSGFMANATLGCGDVHSSPDSYANSPPARGVYICRPDFAREPTVCFLHPREDRHAIYYGIYDDV